MYIEKASDKIASINNIKETVIAYGSVTAAYVQYIDLGTDYVYTNMQIVSDLDEDAIIRIGTTNTVISLAGEDKDYQNLNHQGIMYIKRRVGASTSGEIIIRHW